MSMFLATTKKQPLLNKYTFLGYDAAGPESPFYSIVGDFPPEESMKRFVSKLNNSGLFENAGDAIKYLNDTSYAVTAQPLV